jgi:hypothetical protein
MASAADTEPRIKDGRALVWFSHINSLGNKEYTNHSGQMFGRAHEIVGSLQPGNIIAVRACAQFPGWENFARRGHLVLRVANKGSLTLSAF